MSEIFFILKSFFLTLVVIIIMQVKVGENTIEEKTLQWIESSPMVSPLQEVASGGVKVVQQAWKAVFGSLNSKFFSAVKDKNLPGKRDLNFVLERSQEYLRDQGDKIKESAQRAAQATQDKLQPEVKKKKKPTDDSEFNE